MINRLSGNPYILYKYFTIDLLKFFLFAFISLVTLIFFIDLVELLRRSSNKVFVDHLQKATFVDIIGMASFKIPSNMEKVLPFAALIGSIACFNQWRKKSYYIISRSFGISLWKIISPTLVTFFLIGITSIIFINPISSIFNKKYNSLQLIFFGKKDLKMLSFDTKGFWIKENSENKQLIINANKINEEKNILINVSIFVFDKNKKFKEKITAKEAKFSKNVISLYNGKLTSRENQLKKFTNYSFPVKSNSNDLKIAINKPDTIFITDLPSYIFKMKKYGLNTSYHLIHFFKLICQPILIISMILLSASFMLRSSERKVEFGIVSLSLVVGFCLYFIGDFIFALGSSEKLPPLIAGFGPTLIGLFSGCYLISDIDEPKKI